MFTGCPFLNHFWWLLTTAYQAHTTRPDALERLCYLVRGLRYWSFLRLELLCGCSLGLWYGKSLFFHKLQEYIRQNLLLNCTNNNDSITKTYKVCAVCDAVTSHWLWWAGQISWADFYSHSGPAAHAKLTVQTWRKKSTKVEPDFKVSRASFITLAREVSLE